jgi:hypothetical protein
MKRFISGIGLALAVLVGFAPPAHAALKAQIFQTALAGLRFDGATLSSGKAYFYSPGTTTVKTVYVDRNKQTQAANPYTLDTNGRAEIFGDGVYDVVIKTSGGVTKATWENVTLQDASVFFDNVENYASLNAAITAIGSTTTRLVINTATTLTGNATVPSTLELEVTRSGSISQGAYDLTDNGPISNTGTITGSGSLTIAGAYTGAGTINVSGAISITGPFEPPATAYVFTGAGTVTGLKEARPAWWGATHNALSTTAVQAAIATGGTVVIPAGTTYIVKNLSITTADQHIVVSGTLKLPNSASDGDTILTATSVDGIRVTGKGTLDGNKAGQSGVVSQSLISFTDCDNAYIGGGLTLKKNYAGNTTGHAVYVKGDNNAIHNALLFDWSKEGIYCDDCKYSSLAQIIAIDADGDSWTAVYAGGTVATHNRISNITTKDTGASAVGLDSTYSVVENVTVDGVLFQNGVNLGHTNKPASYSSVSNVVVKGIRDTDNDNSAGLSIVNGTVGVLVSNFAVYSSNKKGINISAGARDVDLVNLRLKDCVTGFSTYSSGTVRIKNMTLEGTVTTGISKDAGGSGHTTLQIDSADLTVAATRITGAAAGLTATYLRQQSVVYDSTQALSGAQDISGLGAGGTVTVTNANARSMSRIVLEPSNTAGASSLPFISTQNDGSFVITTVNNGGAGASVRWKII